LTAVIGMMQQLAVGCASSERHHERVHDQVSGLSFAHRPARQALVVEVLDAGEEQFPVAARELGDVSDPPDSTVPR
jgi:hypothetical protein